MRMKRYSTEFKESVVRKMMPPARRSRATSRERGGSALRSDGDYGWSVSRMDLLPFMTILYD